MQIINCEQGSPEWFRYRAGRPTASCLDKIITSRGAASTQTKKYMMQLAGEYVTGDKESLFQTQAMTRGIEMESEARDFYELLTGASVEQVGFCITDLMGCSPDGLIGEDGGLEIKCPSISVHVEYLLGYKLPTKYFQQVQGSLYVTGRKWWDFMSYYPAMKPLIVRVLPDMEWHQQLESELIKFNSDLKWIIKKIS